MRRVGLDTNIFMGIFLEENDKLEPSLDILKLITDGTLEGVISSISLVEIATLFCQKNEDLKGEKAVGLIRGLPNTSIVDVTPDIAVYIARLKVSEKLSIADAAVLSAAVEMAADTFLTYDNDFAKVKKIRCMKPGDYLKTLKE